MSARNSAVDYNKLVDTIDDDELAESIADKCYDDVGQSNGDAIEAYRTMLLHVINEEGE